MKKWKFLTALAALTLVLSACNTGEEASGGDSSEK